jgi:hypothetical protein
MTEMGSAMMSTDTTIAAAATHLPSTVMGTTSPYPTCVHRDAHVGESTPCRVWLYVASGGTEGFGVTTGQREGE